MIFERNKLNKIVAIALILALFSACSGEDLQNTSKQEKSAEICFTLDPVMMKSAASSKTRSSVKQANALSVKMGDSSSDNAAKTRSSTNIDEFTIAEVCVFQFSGTEPATSTLVKSTYYSSLSSMNLITTLTESSTTQTVYVVANVGNITGKYTNETTLSSFQISLYEMATEASVTIGSRLPMVGTYTGATMPGLYAVPLVRLVAKLTFSCNISLTNTNDAFTINSVRLYSVPNVAQIVAPTGIYPGNMASDAGKYINYAVEAFYPTGTELTWYIPENLRGIVSSITTEEDKSKANAPIYSTYIEVEGIYTPNNGTAEYVVYRLYPGANLVNDFNIVRNTSYGISMTIKGMNEADARVVVPKNLSMDNTGKQVTANCYIANDGNKDYKFKATVMGNGATTPASTSGDQMASAIVPIALSPVTAFVIWETGSKGDVIEDGSVKLVGNYVRFRAADNSINGNALIGVKNASGILIWSWHIWKTDYAPDVNNSNTYDTYVTRALSSPVISSSTFKMMKYNVGATATNYTAANAGDLGLFYQWGRKDPFVGASGWTNMSGTGSPHIGTTNTFSYEWHDGYANPAIVNTSAIVSGYTAGADVSIAYSLQYPTRFIAGTSTDTYDWLNVTQYSKQRDNLWGNPNATTTTPNTATGSKSIYDPCPPGWRAPRQDSFTRFTTEGDNVTNESKFNVLNTSINFATTYHGWYFYCEADKMGYTSYFPASGVFQWDSGALHGVNAVGHIWTSSSYAGGTVVAGLLYFDSGWLYPLYGACRAYGLPVRCAQEE